MEDEREEELETLSSIYPELVRDPIDPFRATLELAITPSEPLRVRFVPDATVEHAQELSGLRHGEEEVELAHLPPLCLDITLPAEYPADAPPRVALRDRGDCLPSATLQELENEAATLWEEYGRTIILFVYIDFLAQAAERGFDLAQTSSGGFVLPAAQRSGLLAFDEQTKIGKFRASTVDCGICLEPKRGSLCHRMRRCGHVFCLQCLQDFYNNAISEGDVGNVRCLDPGCGKEKAGERRRKSARTLQPRELLDMGLAEAMVRRYVEMKRKKKMEADKTTVYCPRTWCQGPARSKKYPAIPLELSTYVLHDSSDSEAEGSEVRTAGIPVPPDPTERLAVCESCSLAFCRVCYMGWHGPFARCFPRDPTELSAEEKASYDYIRLHTSPCPTCNSPTSKTMGCNHMSCFQCKTHFCYLCGAWLDGSNPYLHFNKPGMDCYQRLWELEGGDDGQAPGDGHGFAGGRGWEQIAMEAAREANEQEAANEAAARAIEAEEAGHAAEAMGAPPRAFPMIVQQMLQLDLDLDDDDDDDGGAEAHLPAQRQPQRRRRHPFNPFGNRPPPPDHAARAEAVRLHERNGRGRGRGAGAQRGGAVMPHPRGREEEQRQQLEFQRFLDMAQRDEEDGWDSDGLGDDEGFMIR
nr:e3 ubiquitin-protein ligase itt1 [Quercus suber]